MLSSSEHKWFSENGILFIDNFNIDLKLLGGQKLGELVKWYLDGRCRAVWEFAMVDVATGMMHMLLVKQ